MNVLHTNNRHIKSHLISKLLELTKKKKRVLIYNLLLYPGYLFLVSYEYFYVNWLCHLTCRIFKGSV